jgi:hypothetical protein
MPYIICPLCGGPTHLVMRDFREWHEQRSPGTPFAILSPGRCFDCWQDLAVGDAVVVRDTLKRRTAYVGEKGTVEAIPSREGDGKVFEVRLESGRIDVFIRAELRKRRDSDG